ncbi:hypothetical protein [Streptomyces kaniharaensis]|uniref:hypothetical protein n=1 Tax=Streptomyces kaniharaensis TaxID=212423 RepID=UPI001E5DD598|nr:hypothetical protein [Streptomyces kaniharaensis]
MSDSARRTIRTVVAVALALLAGLPLLVRTAALPDTLPGLGTVLAVAAAITRAMALPQVNGRLPDWLQMTPTKAPLLDPTATTVPTTTEPSPGSRE